MYPKLGHWQALALAWAVSLVLVGIGYVVWSWLGGEPVHWDYFGRAALVGGGGAVLLMAWRGVRGKLGGKDPEGKNHSEGGDE